MRGRLFPVAEDWCEWRQTPPLAGTVLVRLTVASGGRLVLSGLRIDGEPSASLLRAIPLGRIEATANAQFASDGDMVVAGPAVIRPRPRPVASPAVDASGWETVSPAVALDRPAAADRTGARGRPDTFYQDVADAYLSRAQASTRPVLDIAGQHGVPVSTAHRWVKEARRRGFLPPGHPGKSG